MVTKKRTIYLRALNPESCLWREQNSPRIKAAEFLLCVFHYVLALLVELVQAFAEGLLGSEWCEVARGL
jgi:hypothetical protein